MRRTLFALLVAAFLIPPASAEAPRPPKGFVALFDGKSLAGWHGMPHFDPYKLAALEEDARRKRLAEWTADAKKHWSVQGDELVNDGRGAYLTTDRDYGDSELTLEYKTVPLADSGVYLRATPQVQIWDTTKAGGKWDIGADKGSGGLYNNAKGSPGQSPLVHADRPFGRWNALRILVVGERVTVHLNGKLVVDHARLENFWKKGVPLPRTGPIQLQTHGGEIRWRNVWLREIGPEEANAVLRKHGSAGFESVFNGKDFAGWAGPLENYEIMDGAIVCKPKKGGNIYTKAEYADFAARVEYRLPPGGNNGLAIRYPGKGQPSSVAMCEVQILDDTAPKYAKLDPRQYNGSSYGMIPAARGYLRSVGEWNFMEVTAVGSTLRVELNGTRILDGDLAKVTKFMGGHPHPGKGRKSGHFGFAGHNDPVAFRLVWIRRYAPLPRAVSSLGACAEGGYVYVYGGHTGRTHAYSTKTVTGAFFRMPVAGGEWEALPPGEPVQGTALVGHAGKVYRVGGMRPRNAPGEKADNHSVAGVAAYDPASKKWSALPDLPQGRSSHDAVFVGDTLYVVGGWTLDGAKAPVWCDTVDALDLKSPKPSWVRLKQPFRRRALGAFALGGKVYAVGGLTPEGTTKRVDVFDPAANTWAAGPELVGADGVGFSPAACVAGGSAFVSGNDGKVYRLEGGRWKPIAMQKVARFVHRLVPGPKGELLVVGGAAHEGDARLVEEIAIPAGR